MERRSKKHRILTVIKALRVANGWTHKDMVEKGFSSCSAYSHLESGKRKVSKRLQMFTSEIFQVRPTFIFDRYGYPVRFSRRDVLSLTMAKRRRGDYV